MDYLPAGFGARLRGFWRVTANWHLQAFGEFLAEYCLRVITEKISGEMRCGDSYGSAA